MSKECRISFAKMLSKHKVSIARNKLATVQVNVGKLCNQACKHCHVDAGPKRTEMINKDTINRILELTFNSKQVQTIDITGGAPELCPYFRYMVQNLRDNNINVIDRCNLTVLLIAGQRDTAQFLANNNVQITASLPCFLADNVDRQRGKGVFAKSIAALKLLNSLGYGQLDTDLQLNLVYNPQGASLPPPQEQLEAVYIEKLKLEYGIVFNNLFTITNMPINRFKVKLQHDNNLDKYMDTLIENFNPKIINNVMCTSLISIDWLGNIYNCDFNQMLGIPYGNSKASIWDIDDFSELKTNIAIGDHCYGCTAGAGSSCSGILS